MTDIEDLRTRYTDSLRHCECGAAWEASEYTVLHQCPSCDGYETWQATRNDGVLALCDEMEALRARVAAAPEVLSEWPKTAEEAPGEWVYFMVGSAITGEFGEADGRVYFVTFRDNQSWDRGVFEPGEFFVRVP